MTTHLLELTVPPCQVCRMVIHRLVGAHIHYMRENGNISHVFKYTHYTRTPYYTTLHTDIHPTTLHYTHPPTQTDRQTDTHTHILTFGKAQGILLACTWSVLNNHLGISIESSEYNT